MLRRPRRARALASLWCQTSTSQGLRASLPITRGSSRASRSVTEDLYFGHALLAAEYQAICPSWAHPRRRSLCGFTASTTHLASVFLAGSCPAGLLLVSLEWAVAGESVFAALHISRGAPVIAAKLFAGGAQPDSWRSFSNHTPRSDTSSSLARSCRFQLRRILVVLTICGR